MHLISTRLHDHLQLPQYFKYYHIHQIRIKIELTSSNQKRNAAEVNHGDDGNSEQSPPKKSHAHMSIVISCLNSDLLLCSSFHHFSTYNYCK